MTFRTKYLTRRGATVLLVGLLARGVSADEPIRFNVRHAQAASVRPTKSPDGRWRVQASGLKLRLFDTTGEDAEGREFTMKARRQETAITTWDFSPDGRRVAIGAGDERGQQRGDSAGEVRVYDIGSKKLLASVDDSRASVGYVWRAKFSADGKSVEISCDDISGK